MIHHFEPDQIPPPVPNGALESANDALRFMFGGNATFTLRSEKTGTRYTYKIRQQNEDAPFFVSVLRGSNNERDYQYIGCIFGEDRGTLKAGAKGMPSVPSFKALSWTLAQLCAHARIPEQLSIFHEGRCCACGRKLTTPESILSGIGPECAKKS
jgi:hypothetical protein